MSDDMLEKMFNMRRSFMKSLNDKIPGSYPELPLDLSSKKSQQLCRDIALRGVEEMFEALQHLKNWRPHRIKDVGHLDRDEFLEEIVDAFNYFFSLILLSGFNEKDLFEAYLKKDKIINKRLKNEY